MEGSAAPKPVPAPEAVLIDMLEGRAGPLTRKQPVVTPGRLEIASGQGVVFTNRTGAKVMMMFPGPWFLEADGLETLAGSGVQAAQLDPDQSLALTVRSSVDWDGDERCAPRHRAYTYTVYCPAAERYAIGDSPPTMIVDPPPPPRTP